MSTDWEILFGGRPGSQIFSFSELMRQTGGRPI
jgi:hypothetical protein